MTVSIRDYHDTDYQACRSLWAQLTQRHRDIYDDGMIGGDDPGGEIDAFLKKPGLARMWVAEQGDKVVAFCGLLVDGEGGEIDPIVVDGVRRSSGIGGRMLEIAIEEARRRGVRFLSIKPVARNVEAIRLYARTGFDIVGQIDMFMDLTEATPREWMDGMELHGVPLRY